MQKTTPSEQLAEKYKERAVFILQEASTEEREDALQWIGEKLLDQGIDVGHLNRVNLSQSMHNLFYHPSIMYGRLSNPQTKKLDQIDELCDLLEVIGV